MKKHLLSLLAITMMIATTIQAQVPTNGLVAYYPFTGNTNDESGNGINLTNHNVSFGIDRNGNTNSSGIFDGSSSYANVIATTRLQPNSYTISCWINKDTLQNTAYASVVTYSPVQWKWGPPYKIFLSKFSLGQVDGRQWSDSTSWEDIVSSLNYITTNKWYHIVMTFDSLSSTQSLYVNDILMGIRKSVLSYSNNSLAGLFVGATKESSDSSIVNFFSGGIDDIRIYNRSLDSTEIQALYHEGGYATSPLTIPKNGLIAWYPFTGNAIDSSGNGNNGIVNGATLTTDRFGKANSAYSFDGSTNYISLQSNYIQDFSSKFTISVWLNQSYVSPNFNQTLVATNAFRFQTATQLVIAAAWSPKGAITAQTNSNALQLNDWTHVVLIKNDSSVAFYINGSKYDSSYSYPSLTSQIVNNLRLGADGLSLIGLNDYFNGKLDDIAIYNRALDSTEIQSLYHQGGYALPITFDNISATKENSDIAINWQTTTELNTNHFIIQHSTDGSSFKDIGTVKAIGSGANSYSFTDNNPTPSLLNGVVYYRLQSVDKDGASTYSKVVSVQLTVNRLPFTVVPNPARDVVTVKGNNIISVQVIDNIGRVVKVVSLKDATNPVLSVSSLAAGVYHLRVQTTDGKVSGASFVIN